MSKKKVLFVGSECHPFVKTGGLGDVMYSLPKVLNGEDYDVRVMLPKYGCIKEQYRQKMKYVTHFYMDLGFEPQNYYVGIMECEMDGVKYYFIDNEQMFSEGNPYTTIPGDIVKFTFFSKAALAALPAIGFIPDVIHCHDWQAGLVPVFLRTLFRDTPVGGAKSIMTIHNLRFQGVCNANTLKYWSGLPEYCFRFDQLGERDGKDANMLKGGLVYADKIGTVSNTYAGEIKTAEYGEGLENVIGYHHMKLSGIVNGIDYDMYDPETDENIFANYSVKDVIEKKKENKLGLQKELGMEQNTDKFVIGLISRLTDQKGLDLLNAIFERVLDPFTQVIILGTGDKQYEDSFRYYENCHKGTVSSNIMYSDNRAHKIYAGVDALLVPSRFEPCGLTQLIAMRYGTIPIVRETGGLRDTVIPYNEFENTGSGFSFDSYDAEKFLNVINYAKTIYFTRRENWDEMVVRDMKSDFSWNNSAKQYKALYESLIS